MLDPDTRIKSKFLTEEGKHINGVIVSSQEGSGVLARGYFIDFDYGKYNPRFLNEKDREKCNPSETLYDKLNMFLGTLPKKILI